MTGGILAIHHVQVTVPADRMAAALHFYGHTLGLAEIPQPARDRPEPGAWYRVGAAELHLRPDTTAAGDAAASRRHVAFAVADLDRLESALAAAGSEFLPDARPVPGQRRLFVRDPGGNRVELMEQP
ncbi:putative enzyme related to lactoylglutathione lyase [Stella humosa]|uniref:Putative enzyme related to lactoylglutathione lyase n=1 Tax=Stella humosa TaxID=94 RepID=A0A3N1KYJ7_9PROT|nr:VOC family protein [Stella humosa]ROP83408.1 putative enzyme related to lactoylglutathione lyase [Stella humosa]BBK29807.1 glyoxalase [Stella humosa]